MKTRPNLDGYKLALGVFEYDIYAKKSSSEDYEVDVIVVLEETGEFIAKAK